MPHNLDRNPPDLSVGRFNELVLHKNQTMSTLEIAGLTGKEHAHVLRDTRNMLIELYEGGVTNFGDTYINQQNGQSYPIYQLPKREALILTSGYSIKQRAAIIDRWQELEDKEKFPALPSYPEALRQLASALELNANQAALLEEQKPAVEFVDRFVEAKSAKGLREVAKILGLKERAFILDLEDHGVIFKLAGNWVPMAQYQHSGYFEVKIGESNGHAFKQMRFTPKGIEWVAKRYIRQSEQ